MFTIQKGLFSLPVAIAKQRGLFNCNDWMADLTEAGSTNFPPPMHALERQMKTRLIVTKTMGMTDDLSAFGDTCDSYRYNNVTYNLSRGSCRLTRWMSFDRIFVDVATPSWTIGEYQVSVDYFWRMCD